MSVDLAITHLKAIVDKYETLEQEALKDAGELESAAALCHENARQYLIRANEMRHSIELLGAHKL